ncbi:hypothetical protein GVX81_09090 [[Haemophilus] felis]|uniref:Uncharacterized protein n=1 Tax=[Haemophilus] felis TaxID=123822 RepID=A0A1T0AVU9_9PAST|nr:hypothetical protein [[Haemophilus] felis]OOS01142.1 hypothetical protein B0188_10170 [[Haemophilus] felis]
MLDIEKTINDEITKRKKKYISFSELLVAFFLLNKIGINIEHIRAFLLLKLRAFNPKSFEYEGRILPTYYCDDLADATKEIERNLNDSAFFDFIDALFIEKTGSEKLKLKVKQWRTHWRKFIFERKFIYDLLGFNRRNAELEKELETANSQKSTSEQFLEYDGDIPLKTDKDKLANTFRLIIQKSDFIAMNGGIYPTYSQLHTMLNRIYPNEPTPAKNTLKKYLEP